jgi:cell division protein FtsQ
MSEPTPPPEDADVPDRVLDELKLVFADPGEAAPVAATEPTDEPAPPVVDTSATAALAPTEAASAVVLSDGGHDAAKPRATIVIGGDDSLPDAVYLDDAELPPLTQPGSEVVGGRNTIVIGDELDSTGAFDAVEVPSRSMDPRVRARRVAVKRARGRKRLVWAGVAVLVVLLGVAVLAVFSSSLFAVDRVDVQGATYTSFYDADQLQAIVDDLKGQPVLLVDTLAFERRLESIPWIERAFVTTDFPNRVFVDIRERRPLAAFEGSDGKYRVIDRDGRVVAVLDGRPTDYMLLTGPAPDTDAGGLAGAPFAAAAQMVSALPSEIRSLAVTASVDATTGDLGLMIMPPPPVTDPATDPASGDSTSAGSNSGSSGADPDPIEVRIGSSANLDSKLARLLQLIRDGLDGVVRIDVSTNEVSVTKG